MRSTGDEVVGIKSQSTPMNSNVEVAAHYFLVHIDHLSGYERADYIASRDRAIFEACFIAPSATREWARNGRRSSPA
jgi:hypothetical protein